MRCWSWTTTPPPRWTGPPPVKSRIARHRDPHDRMARTSRRPPPEAWPESRSHAGTGLPRTPAHSRIDRESAVAKAEGRRPRRPSRRRRTGSASPRPPRATDRLDARPGPARAPPLAACCSEPTSTSTGSSCRRHAAAGGRSARRCRPPDLAGRDGGERAADSRSHLDLRAAPAFESHPPADTHEASDRAGLVVGRDAAVLPLMPDETRSCAAARGLRDTPCARGTATRTRWSRHRSGRSRCIPSRRPRAGGQRARGQLARARSPSAPAR